MARGRELAGAKGDWGKAQRDPLQGSGGREAPHAEGAADALCADRNSFDAASGKVQDPYLRWVIYVPFATPQSTGLSTKASESAPWLMAPGTAGAHIMINPPKK